MKKLAVFLILFVVLSALSIPLAGAAPSGPKIEVKCGCTITIQQRGYIAGDCDGGRYFGTNTARWKSFPLETIVTVSGYEEWDLEISHPKVKRCR